MLAFKSQDLLLYIHYVNFFNLWKCSRSTYTTKCQFYICRFKITFKMELKKAKWALIEFFLSTSHFNTISNLYPQFHWKKSLATFGPDSNVNLTVAKFCLFGCRFLFAIRKYITMPVSLTILIYFVLAMALGFQ